VSNRRIALGHRGEDWAAEWYADNGYEILARNWRHAEGEIDIVCGTVDEAGCTVLVVCEVKARTSNSHGHPLEAVTPAKQHRLRRLAGAYLRTQGVHFDHVRFDVVGVTGQALHVVEDAF
jgi:putative endonuclease